MPFDFVMKINEVENDKFMERVVSATFNLLVSGFHKRSHILKQIFLFESTMVENAAFRY